MYLSLNGDDLRSVIVLLVAEELTGDWTYVGPVVYSGFTGQDIARTDANDVLREAAATSSPMDAARILDVARYMSRKDTRINAIDAAPVLCEDGTMWLAFGSWFAGIWMLRLDSATGLRDRSIRYPLIRDTTGNASVSDPYYGVKIAGGYWNSGEGAYLVQRDGWWFLMLSYGWLGAPAATRSASSAHVLRSAPLSTCMETRRLRSVRHRTTKPDAPGYVCCQACIGTTVPTP